MTPFVSLIIPARNEEACLDLCFKSLLIDGTYPHERMEIIFVDGMSTDRTRDIVAKWQMDRPGIITFIENPKKTIPAAMNLGLRIAKGEFIFKIDAHSSYGQDYVHACIRHHMLDKVDNVGGLFIHTARENTPVAHAVATVMGHPLGGGAAYRVGVTEPRYADTAAFGCYKRSVFTTVGVYDERFERSSDMDLNTRIRQAGGKILLAPDIHVFYYPPATLKDFTLRTYRDGVWATYPLAFGARFQRPRHLAPLAALMLALAIFAVSPMWVGVLALAYLAVVVSIGAMHSGSIAEFIVFPLVFAVRHWCYGAGSLVGVFKAINRRLDNRT